MKTILGWEEDRWKVNIIIMAAAKKKMLKISFKRYKLFAYKVDFPWENIRKAVNSASGNAGRTFFYEQWGKICLMLIFMEISFQIILKF